MDTVSPEVRSRTMSRIRGKNTTPEMFIRSLLHRKGFRFRVNYSKITGTPDIYFTKKRVAIFIQGCFWHQHEGCITATVPKSNVEYWEKKFERNKQRDDEVLNSLLSDGIRVLYIWECTIRKMKKDALFYEEIIQLFTRFMVGTENNFKVI
ncbi:MAG: very short patch repair endonuclease [Saccharofermentanales bacterium]